jgi:hypothetical protein
MITVALLQQNTDLLRDLLANYGWLGIVVYIITREMLPWLREHFSAAHKEKLAREEEDRQTRAKREEKLTLVLEQFGSQLHTFGLAMTVVTERLTAIERDQDIVMRTMEVLADRKQRERSRIGFKEQP